MTPTSSGGEEQNSISGGSQFPVWYSLRQEILKFVVDKYWNGWYDNQVVWETDIGKQLRAFFIYDFGKNKNEKSSWQVWKDLINCQSCLKTRQWKQKFSNKNKKRCWQSFETVIWYKSCCWETKATARTLIIEQWNNLERF